MNALELMQRLGGEVLGHKIRAVIGGETVVLARMEGTEFALTEEGQALADEQSHIPAAKAPKAPKAPKAQAPIAPDSAAVESDDVSPEL